ncbi:MAG: class C beta-lactamase-related serine hydrolase [Saprospirales bacterium]|nr:MAG: class C beta-lactamase-related serine hydrolase [Saprospirales bacterium]
MAEIFDIAKLDQLLEKIVDNKSIFSTVMKIENSDGSFSWSGACGDMQSQDRYFIASVTKLYITAVLMKLIEEEKITLTDKISDYLPDKYWKDLHLLNGIDYSDQISILHLISNTSGLPDYFFHKQKNGRAAADELLDGNDSEWPIDKTIELVKKMKPNFKPGAKSFWPGTHHKAAYSDTNYQLLGKILEQVTGKPISEIFRDYIFSELNFENTYVYTNQDDHSPVPFYYGAKKLWLPKYISSVGPEGGIVSTADEVMFFIKAFFSGRFFPSEKIEVLKKWNLIFPPPGLFLFGIGLEKLWIPWIASPLKHPGEILGFWGQTGSFAFYNPKSDLYFCGSTNQINGKGHRLAAGMMLKVIKSVI